MIHTFTSENVETIAKVLGTQAKPLGDDVFRLELTHTETDRKLALEIHLGLLGMWLSRGSSSCFSIWRIFVMISRIYTKTTKRRKNP